MDLMRFHGFPAILLPHRPAPPFEKTGGRAGQGHMLLSPPRGVGAKRQNVPLPPVKI
jgi:hypothetical protein